MTSFVLSPEQAADLLACTPLELEARTLSGSLPGIRYGLTWVYPTQALVLVLNETALALMRERNQAAHPALVPMPCKSPAVLRAVPNEPELA